MCECICVGLSPISLIPRYELYRYIQGIHNKTEKLDTISLVNRVTD